MLLDWYRKHARTIIEVVLLVLTVWLIFWIFSWVYRIAKPVFFALAIYLIIRPMVQFFKRRKIPTLWSTILALLIFLVGIVGSLVVVFLVFFVQIKDFIVLIPQLIQSLMNQLAAQISLIPEETLQGIREQLTGLAQTGSDFVLNLLGQGMNALTTFSSFVVYFSLGVLLAFFLSLESEMWLRWYREKTPPLAKQVIDFLYNHALRGIGTYLKAQLKLVSITFVLVFAGLLILRQENAFSLALLCAILDLVPLLGIAMLFLPWIAYLFFTQQTVYGLAIAVLFLVVVAVRQFLEPRIMSNTLGVSAFTMLSFALISTALFGVAGLILSPILLILIKSLYEEGILQRWFRQARDGN